MKEVERLKKAVDMLQEFGEDWKKNVAILNDVAKDKKDMLSSIKHLSKEGNQGNLLKIGLALLAFPFPIVIDDILGSSLLVAGLIQARIKNSALYLEDVNKNFPHLLRELQEVRQETV